LNETGDNLYDHYLENPFSVLESPPMTFGGATRASDGEIAEDRGLPHLDGEALDLDAPSVNRVGPDELARLGAVPVRRADGSLRIVVSETTSERVAAVREHFSADVALALVTASTLERLLDAARTPTAPAEAEAGTGSLGETFERVLSLFDEEAGRFDVLRQRVQQLGSQTSEREHRLQQLEAELARIRVEREQDQVTIENLRNDLAERERRLDRAATKAQELAAIIRGSASL
jgi:Type II secretion system (T2SS), protein E, N-terminal domain